VFAHEFYTATADGYALGAALREARKAMFTQQLGVEWATPVLCGVWLWLQAAS